MALDTLTYELEPIFQEVSSELISIYTELFGYECKILQIVEDKYTGIYGTKAGKASNYTHIDTRIVLVVHEQFSWTSPSKVDLGSYSAMKAYVRHDEELPVSGTMELTRLDNKQFRFKVEYLEDIGSVVGIVKRYHLTQVI